MSKLSKEQIEKIAQLARIELTEKEKSTYAEQLSGILEFVKKLAKADTKGVEETSQVTGLENVYREDKVIDWNPPTPNRVGAPTASVGEIDKNKKINREKLLSTAPDKKDGYFKVKQILV